MARITVEDCIDKFPSRFELVLIASQRARKLHSGEKPTVENDNDKNTVIALREIADSTLTVEVMKENLIQEYQTITINDEEEENVTLESIEIEGTKEDNKNESNLTNEGHEVEEEMNDLISSEDSEIEKQYVIDDNINNNNSSITDEKQEDTQPS